MYIASCLDKSCRRRSVLPPFATQIQLINCCNAAREVWISTIKLPGIHVLPQWSRYCGEKTAGRCFSQATKPNMKYEKKRKTVMQPRIEHVVPHNSAARPLAHRKVLDYFSQLDHYATLRGKCVRVARYWEGCPPRDLIYPFFPTMPHQSTHGPHGSSLTSPPLSFWLSDKGSGVGLTRPAQPEQKQRDLAENSRSQLNSHNMPLRSRKLQ
jgi:hypothetical protein